MHMQSDTATGLPVAVVVLREEIVTGFGEYRAK